MALRARRAPHGVAIVRWRTAVMHGEERLTALHREGDPGSGWVLLDYGDVVLHVFAPAEREYYRLEELWGAGLPVVQIH